MKRSAFFLALAAFLFGGSTLAITTFAASEPGNENRDAELLAARDNPAIVKRGKRIYRDVCQSCHGDEKVTVEAVSNLFDAKWYHGDRPSQIEHNTLTGFLEKGMPAWKEVLPSEDVAAVTAYLLTFQKH